MISVRRQPAVRSVVVRWRATSDAIKVRRTKRQELNRARDETTYVSLRSDSILAENLFARVPNASRLRDSERSNKKSRKRDREWVSSLRLVREGNFVLELK